MGFFSGSERWRFILGIGDKGSSNLRFRMVTVGHIDWIMVYITDWIAKGSLWKMCFFSM